MASLLVLGFTILNCFGVGRTAKVQNVLTGTKIVVIVSFIVLGFLAGTGSWEHFSMTAVRTSTTALPAQFVISLLWVMVAYSGWNAATYVAEELRRPERTLPAALAVGTALVTALFLGLNLIFIYSTPLEQMKGVVAVGSLAASNLFGPQVAGIFAALMALSIMSTVNAEVTIGPRVYYAMAKNKAFFKVGGDRASALAHARGRHPLPGRLRHADDADAVSATGDLHRLQPDVFHRAVGGVAVCLPPPARLAAAARRQLLPIR